MKFRHLSTIFVGTLLVGAALPASANLVINATFDSSITSNGNSALMQAAINQSKSAFESKLLDNITVNIRFVDQASGLGASSASTVNVTYQDLRNHMISDQTSADDLAAIAGLPNQVNDPVLNGNLGIDITTAQARALGFNAPSTIDCTIWLNSSICGFNHGGNNAGKYDYMTVASHEIGEALGIGGWGSNIGFSGGCAMLDLFRYDQNGNRTHTTASGQAYFSLDGVTHIDQFNQAPNGGDYADWIVHATPQTQDWAGTAGPGADLGITEIRALDVSGYNLATVPEPTSLVAMGLGLVGLTRIRRRK
jgi:hypothetical protein